MAGTKKDLQEFVKRWKGRGREDEEDQKFWNDFLMSCLGISPESLVSFIDYQKKVYGKAADGKYHRRKIDAYIPDHRVLIEQKSADKDLDKPRNNREYGWETPYEQAHWYYANMPISIRPDYIITCNFQTFRIHNLDSEKPDQDYVEISLDELPKHIHLFDFIKSEQTSRIHKEQELSKASEQYITKLYDALTSRYKHLEDSKEEQRSLNILITRIGFLPYAEDADLLYSHTAFGDYCQGDPVQLRGKLIALFKALDTPETERDEYDGSPASAFPYMNGGLFSDATPIIPTLDAEIATIIAEASSDFNWSEISPTIFGSVFESTLNPETRAENGMHYTTVENIHRVIDPLFLNELRRDLHAAEGYKSVDEQRRKLAALHERIASIRVLDPACGSGNFLTETYLQLREIENRIIEDEVAIDAEKGKQSLLVDDSRIRVKLSQFYGIEINSFAVAVAKTALWISEVQMLAKTRELLPALDKEPLPLSKNENIHEDNALAIDWNTVLPADQCSYICGNPPFYGGKRLDESQRKDMRALFGKIKLVNSIDYVSAWYVKACDYMMGNQAIRAALVSTNSICQGEQVYPIWHTLMGRYPLHINFCWRTFVWDNQAIEKAHVHVIIVGFSVGQEERLKEIFDGDAHYYVEHINPYLVEGPDVIAEAAPSPIDHRALTCVYGSLINDGGNFIMKPDELDEYLRIEPQGERFIRPLVGSDELIKGKKRFVLYLRDASPSELLSMPDAKRRVENVRAIRLESSAEATRKTASTPQRFYFDGTCTRRFLVIPSVSSERRRYVPMAFCEPDVVATNLVSTVEGAGLYEFGVLTSQAHNAWMRSVAGRLKSDYRYSPKTVYNTFVWPTPSEEQRFAIEAHAQAVLDARKRYSDCTLAQLYDPKNEWLFPELVSAHKALDKAVEAAYGVGFDGDEKKIVAHLFKLYAQMTEGEQQ